jgi:hypothetical protein
MTTVHLSILDWLTLLSMLAAGFLGNWLLLARILVAVSDDFTIEDGG